MIRSRYRATFAEIPHERLINGYCLLSGDLHHMADFVKTFTARFSRFRLPTQVPLRKVACALLCEEFYASIDNERNRSRCRLFSIHVYPLYFLCTLDEAFAAQQLQKM